MRLVFQPIVERLSVRGIIRDHYADDRAIHALYRLDHENEDLKAVIDQVSDGARLTDLAPELLERFEARRDQQAAALIEQVMSLRLTDGDYTLVRERPEFYELGLEERFLAGLLDKVLSPLCQVEALHELTAFSLPLGRSPVSLDLWSFVAFSQEGGSLKQEPIAVFSRVDGQELFRFSGDNELLSEDVTVSQGDPQVERAIDELPDELGEQLVWVILETQLNDPEY